MPEYKVSIIGTKMPFQYKLWAVRADEAVIKAIEEHRVKHPGRELTIVDVCRLTYSNDPIGYYRHTDGATIRMGRTGIRV